MPGIINDHPYTIVGGEGLESDSDGGQGGLEIDLPRETRSPRGEGSGSGVTSPRLSQGSDSPTGSESPACSLPDNDNIPDAKKYKNRMLARYLNDAEEAQWHNNRKNSQGTTNGDFSSEDGDLVYPDQSNLSAGHETGVVGNSDRQEASTTQHGYDTPPTLLPQTEQWQPVDGNLIPTPSNNITISFTHLPLEKDLVPVLTHPPRDNMGVDKVKRQLDLRSESESGPVFNSAQTNQTVYVSLPTVPLSNLPSDQFSTTPYSIKSEGGRSNSSSPISSVSSPNKVFPSRPPFIGSILPGPFPFYPGAPLNGWHFPVGPVPFPHFLHLAAPPDPSEYHQPSVCGKYLRLLVRPLGKCRIASTNRRPSPADQQNKINIQRQAATAAAARLEPTF